MENEGLAAIVGISILLLVGVVVILGVATTVVWDSVCDRKCGKKKQDEMR